MRAITLISIIMAVALAAPAGQCRGGGGHGGGGGGHCGGSGHSSGSAGHGFGHATGGLGGNPAYWMQHRRGGYIRPYWNNAFVDDEQPPYEPIGPSAAGGNVDPALTRDDFVKTYVWAHR